MRPFLFVFIFFFNLASCFTQQPLHEVQLSPNHILELLDSSAASKAIIQDEMENYFEQVNLSEMSIQMKTKLNGKEKRGDVIDEYRRYLQTEVVDFSSSEAEFTAEVFREVFEQCQKFGGNIFPPRLKLIKTKANHYGASVYYTRENCIVIPANELKAKSREAFTSTMYHELFHVYSRLNLEKRKALYELIGFQGIGIENLNMPDSLVQRILVNPDGVDYAQKITLKVSDSTTIQAIPVLYSNIRGFAPGKPQFFQYVDFALYEIRPTENNRWSVITQANDYSSTLDINQLPDFFRQIGPNTNYIIHPDEILADNFSFLLRSQENPRITSRFSESGKKLLQDIKAKLLE